MRKVVFILSACSVGAVWAADVAPAAGGPDASATLSWDNGSPGMGWTSSSPIGNDFSIATLAGYNYVTSCRMYYYANWPNSTWEGGALYAYAFSGGTPGSLLMGPRYVRGSGSVGGWQNFTVGWSLGATQNFVFAYSCLYNYPGNDPAVLDTGPGAGHTWYYYSGVWTRINDRNLILRVAVDDSFSGVQPASFGRVKAMYY